MPSSPYDTLYQDPTTVYTSLVYALTGLGGYNTVQAFNNIQITAVPEIVQYDVTNSVQVLLNATLLNSKIGLVKDVSDNIISTSYNGTYFSSDTLTISAYEFIQNLRNVNSVGYLKTMYEDFCPSSFSNSNFIAPSFET